MPLFTRLLVTSFLGMALLGFCSAPARAQVVPSWLPGLSVKLLVRVIEFNDLVGEEIRERLQRRPLFDPRPTPPLLLPAGEPPLEPVRACAVGIRPLLRPDLVP